MAKLFHTLALPGHWIVEDDHQLFMVPANQFGWNQKQRYQGHYTLTESPPEESRVILGTMGLVDAKN